MPIAGPMQADGPAICIEKPSGFVGGRVLSALQARGVRCVAGATEDSFKEGPRVLLLNRWGSVPSTTARSARAEADASLLPLLDLVDATNWNDVDHVVFLSSAGAIYGPASASADEGTVPRPGSNYGAGKLAAEAFLAAAATRLRFPLTVLRPSNLYGPGQQARPGFGIVPAIHACLSTGAPVQLWPGSDVRKDYLYIDDFVDALAAVLLGAAPEAGVAQVFNLASGYCASVPELISLCATVRAGGPGAVDVMSERVAQVEAVAPDARRFREHYGWQPNHDLRAGLRATFDWLDEQLT